MIQEVLVSMPPGMVRALKTLDGDRDAVVHGPMLKGLVVRGLVTIHQDIPYITWKGQQVLTHLERNT